MVPQNLPEKAVWYGIVGTYPVYLIGGLYILAPALGWSLLATWAGGCGGRMKTLQLVSAS